MTPIKWLVTLFLFSPTFFAATPLSSVAVSRTGLEPPSVHAANALIVRSKCLKSDKFLQVTATPQVTASPQDSLQVLKIFLKTFARFPVAHIKASRYSSCSLQATAQIIKHNSHGEYVPKLI
ncbi:hypothetical protein C8R45DRAFT_1101381 [Mycena sanguinolenta]|nr:hypothetical protein C8R45DRAFT_1101381 [Mycena sanguinolenta]